MLAFIKNQNLIKAISLFLLLVYPCYILSDIAQFDYFSYKKKKEKKAKTSSGTINCSHYSTRYRASPQILRGLIYKSLFRFVACLAQVSFVFNSTTTTITSGRKTVHPASPKATHASELAVKRWLHLTMQTSRCVVAHTEEKLIIVSMLFTAQERDRFAYNKLFLAVYFFHKE